MRISWLSAEEIAAARQALTADGATWNDHFAPTGAFAAPPSLIGQESAGHERWDRITEHVARAERISEVIREHGFEAALLRFGTSPIAIERATLAAAAHEGELLDLDRIIEVLRSPIDPLVFYAPFLELLVSHGRDQVDRTVAAYEEFVAAYTQLLAGDDQYEARLGAVRDGLADFYVSAGRLDEAEALFERRHAEDRGDVAVALTASRAFLAAGSVSHAVRWLGVGADRATALGREDLAERLRKKQDRIRERLS